MILLTQWIEHFVKIKLEPHQKLILDHCFTFDEEGKLPYQVIVYSAPKKSGKTELNSNVMGYWAYNVEPPNEIITVANKRDQAISRGFKRLKQIIQSDPVLLNEAYAITGNQIILRNGSTVLAIPIHPTPGSARYRCAAGSGWSE